MASVFVKRYPSRGELPSKIDYYFCLDEYDNLNSCYFDGKNIVNDNCVIINPEYWLEEIELPSEEEVSVNVKKGYNWGNPSNNALYQKGVDNASEYILNKQK